MFLQRETSHSSLWLSSTLLCICISYKYISCLPGGCNTVFLLVSCCFDCCIFVVWCEVREPDTFQLYYAFSRSVQSVQLHSHVHLFATPWTTACQASLSISRSLLKLMSTELVMPSNHLIHCCPLLLLPSIVPSIRGFSSESVLCIRWPNYWNFSFKMSLTNEYSELISFRTDWFDLLAVQGTLLQHHIKSINSWALSLLYGPTLTSTWLT